MRSSISRVLRFLPLPLTFGLALLVTLPGESQAFDTLGHKLGLSQRDFRVFNNFSDSTANDNTVPDPQFPGKTGAVLAIWKACVEWGSELHGDGSGDPFHTLGSGGANFDASFQGEATGPGGSNSNVHSELNGSSGGILAFAVSSSAGWRIRYYSGWTWNDGPGSISGVDLQGVATHEYGHALGLGHSGSSNATMRPSIIGNGIATRSIEADDIDGVRAVYGVKSATKPRITGVSIAGDTVTITGQNFSPSNNEVWFSQAENLLQGDPPKITGVDSTNGGTLIQVQVAPGAGPGDLLVRGDGTNNASLSNAWPYDAVGPPLPELEIPVITGIQPDTVPALIVGNEQTITLTGEHFEAVSNVDVGNGQLPFFPPQYTVIDSNTITLTMPAVNTLGDVDITVEGTSGSTSFPIQVVPADPPALELGQGYDVGVIVSLSGFELTMAGEPGLLFLPMASWEFLPTTIPGVIDLDIGNGFTSILFLGAFVIEPKGWVRQSFPIGLVPGTLPVWFQGVEYDPLLGTASIRESNSVEGLIVF